MSETEDDAGGTVVGLLFQPRRSVDDAPDDGGAWPGEAPDRRLVFRAALEGALLGDVTHFHRYLTDDVLFCSPHVTVSSRVAAERAFGVPEETLGDIHLALMSLDEVGDKMTGEWQLDATFCRPLMFDDDLLIEPTGGLVHLRGFSIAEFRATRIAEFRHYFDDSEMLRQVPGVPAHVRWSSALLGQLRY